MRVKSQIALITGGSSGIGLELAKLFAKQGCSLVLVARKKGELENSKKELEKNFGAKQVLVFACDLSQASSPKKVFEFCEKKKIVVEILVNNAGFATYGKFAETGLQMQLDMLGVNVNALVELTGLLLPQMLERKSGKILNIASTAAFQPGPLMAVYYASKAFVLSFSEALAEELEGSGVGVTALCPGPTWTNFQRRAGMLGSKILAGNVMNSEEVARQGFGGLMRGERVVIPGLRNKLGTKIVKIIPRKLLTKIIRKIQEERRVENL